MANSLSKYLRILPVIGFFPLIIVTELDVAPVFRLLAICFSLGSVIALTFANFRLSQQTIRLSRDIDDHVRLVTQRQRCLIGVEIHQTVSQLLFAITLITDAMIANEDTYPREIVAGLKDLHQLTSTTHTAIRHILFELRPTRINEVPLDRLITELVQIRRCSTKTDIQCIAIGTGQYPPNIHHGLYQIADLALSNSVFHAQASYIQVRLFLSQDEAMIAVEDDGCGFDPTQRKPEHFGLDDIETCAREIGATLDWHTAPGPYPKKITCIWRRPTWN